MGVLGNKLQKLQILLNEILCIMILPVFSNSCEILKLISRAPIRDCLRS